MQSNSSPNISINPTGQEPSIDVSRIMERVKRLKLAITKPTVKAEKRALLQAEIDKHMKKIAALKSALDDV